MKKEDIARFNEIYPLGMLPQERVDWLVKLYLETEKRRMELWGMIQEIRRFAEPDLSDLAGTIPKLDSMAEYKKGILRITVKDYLPRKCLTVEKGAISQLSNHWLYAIRDALTRLGVEPKIKKADTLIISYVPHNRVVDPDNLAFELIMNALRFNRIINNDSIKETTFRVEGRVDKDNPRTEIYVYEYRDLLEELDLNPF